MSDQLELVRNRYEDSSDLIRKDGFNSDEHGKSSPLFSDKSFIEVVAPKKAQGKKKQIPSKVTAVKAKKSIGSKNNVQGNVRMKGKLGGSEGNKKDAMNTKENTPINKAKDGGQASKVRERKFHKKILGAQKQTSLSSKSKPTSLDWFFDDDETFTQH